MGGVVLGEGRAVAGASCGSRGQYPHPTSSSEAPSAEHRAALARPRGLSWVSGGRAGQGGSGVPVHRPASSPAPRCADPAWRGL